MKTPTRTGILPLIEAIIADKLERPELYATASLPPYGDAQVQVVAVDAADNRVYAVNSLGLTLCLRPEQVTLHAA